MTEKKQWVISGDNLIEKVKELVHEGNITRLRIIHKGHPLVDIPLTAGATAAAVTVLALPVLAAIGAIAALVAEVTLEVEKTTGSEETSKKAK